jgi:hypothetical protein
VPDGTYSGGNVTAPHPATNGKYQGWLVLVAESPHDVVVDLSSGMLNLYPGTSRIMFVGFKFINGMVKITGADHIRFWYTEHTFPTSEWYRQWVAVGGGLNVSETQGLAALARMGNPRPHPVEIRNYQSYTASNIELYGVDIHDAETGLTIQGQDHLLVGARIWNMSEGNYDPGYGGSGGATDLFHPDGIFTGGGVYSTTVQHSFLGARTEWAGQTGAIEGTRMDDLWMAGSVTAGIIVDSWGPTNSGALTNIQSFGNRYGLRVDWHDGHTTVWPAMYYTSLTTANINTTAPPGTLDANGQINLQTVLAHPDNPANRWRATNPYDNWPTLFS